ncbi:unnamed protein product [Blumeria hordei]|uniref:Uncharacterized protein n=1 Tax=Blumeria hordei TaxID=2867405 RepID=A0A383UMR7_BLUHO|nr:unnamed protein product [Blumeria hordei]
MGNSLKNLASEYPSCTARTSISVRDMWLSYDKKMIYQQFRLQIAGNQVTTSVKLLME